MTALMMIGIPAVALFALSGWWVIRSLPPDRTSYSQAAIDVAVAVAYEAGYLDGEDGTPLERGQLHVRPELVKLLPDEEIDG